MDKPTKPSNLMPRSFGGVKNNFSAGLQASGYEDGVPAIYGGDNLNYQLDATGKELDYCEKIVDFINGIPVGKTITVDSNNKLVYANNIDFSSRNIGEIVASTIPLTDAGLHLLDGSLLVYGSYKNFIDYIADLYDSGNYTSIFTTEANWQSSVTTYGVCGKFVYDSVNNTVRLPKITGFIEGASGVANLGDLTTAGLPQHTHTRGNMEISGAFVNNGHSSGGSASGAFSALNNLGYLSNRGDAEDGGVYDFYASRNWTGSTSNANYTSTVNISNKVQPQSIKVLYYIVIATTTKTEIEVDIDEIATDLNGKVGTDLANINDSGEIVIAHNSAPSNIYSSLTLGSSGTSYTAPADGYFWIGGARDAVFANIRIVMRRPLDHFGVSTNTNGTSTSGGWLGAILPVKKNDIVDLFYYTVENMGDVDLRFYYAKGSESEAS